MSIEHLPHPHTVVILCRPSPYKQVRARPLCERVPWSFHAYVAAEMSSRRSPAYADASKVTWTSLINKCLHNTSKLYENYNLLISLRLTDETYLYLFLNYVFIGNLFT